MIPDVDPAALLKALATFDNELRSTPQWKDWNLNRAHHYAIRHQGRLYPVKQIISLATGVPVQSFSGGDEANAFARKRDFDVVELTHDRDDSAAQDEVVSELRKVLEGYQAARAEKFGSSNAVHVALQTAAQRLQNSPALANRSQMKVVASAGKT
jgi:hypothetical protein